MSEVEELRDKLERQKRKNALSRRRYYEVVAALGFATEGPFRPQHGGVVSLAKKMSDQWSRAQWQQNAT